MKCLSCLYPDTKVIDSRVVSEGLIIRRRRECLKCGFRFSTKEEMEILDLVVIKKDGSREEYSREKLQKGLKLALEKRPIEEETLLQLINWIEWDIQLKNPTEISSAEIGKLVLKYLRKVDKVAYIRFASVYEACNSVEEFVELLNEFEAPRKK